MSYRRLPHYADRRLPMPFHPGTMPPFFPVRPLRSAAALPGSRIGLNGLGQLAERRAILESRRLEQARRREENRRLREEQRQIEAAKRRASEQYRKREAARISRQQEIQRRIAAARARRVKPKEVVEEEILQVPPTTVHEPALDPSMPPPPVVDTEPTRDEWREIMAEGPTTIAPTIDPSIDPSISVTTPGERAPVDQVPKKMPRGLLVGGGIAAAALAAYFMMG